MATEETKLSSGKSGEKPAKKTKWSVIAVTLVLLCAVIWAGTHIGPSAQARKAESAQSVKTEQSAATGGAATSIAHPPSSQIATGPGPFKVKAEEWSPWIPAMGRWVDVFSVDKDPSHIVWEYQDVNGNIRSSRVGGDQKDLTVYLRVKSNTEDMVLSVKDSFTRSP